MPQTGSSRPSSFAAAPFRYGPDGDVVDVAGLAQAIKHGDRPPQLLLPVTTS
ncbi:hypothetical protein [Microbispora bryophytorum]|uniref:hypothetical protein n=1 Tax=Microbispora bryophytorum TaxID=1460882 RepID=UPI00371B1A98